METLKIDYNSAVNHNIKSNFVAREVLACFSYEMELILKAGNEGVKDMPSFEDVKNPYLDCEKYYKGYGYESAEAMQDDGANLQEIYEWWIVTEFLYKKLKNKGEPVLEWGNNYYWGRTCTGQAILLDNVISEICGEIEILDGQKYSWAK